MNYSFKMHRGDTFLSDFITLYDDVVPEFATPEELAEYTTVDLSGVEITGHVRTEQDGLKLFELAIVKDDSRFHFEIHPDSTKELSGTDQTLVYDIQTKDQDGAVQTICGGSITVLLDITTANAF